MAAVKSLTVGKGHGSRKRPSRGSEGRGFFRRDALPSPRGLWHHAGMTTSAPPHVLALFSGGLDSILAAKLVQEQGRRVTCLHFVSPFFGKPHLLEGWRATHGLDIVPVDVGEEYVALLRQGPPHGYGKVLNPCVDCKVLMLRKARELLTELDAQAIVSGEVLGQRPMSQRRDALDIISRDAGVRDLLVRPLCARHLAPTRAEEEGVLDRSRLESFWGRGRNAQMALAERLGITEIPTPAGGCLLAEKESALRYWPILTLPIFQDPHPSQGAPAPSARDFHIANVGRQFWKGSRWLAIGRDRDANARLAELVRQAPSHDAGDALLATRDVPGPFALARQWPGHAWTPEELAEAASLLLRFSPKARQQPEPVAVRCMRGGEETILHARPADPAHLAALGWFPPSLDALLAGKKRMRTPWQEGQPAEDSPDGGPE